MTKSGWGTPSSIAHEAKVVSNRVKRDTIFFMLQIYERFLVKIQ